MSDTRRPGVRFQLLDPLRGCRALLLVPLFAVVSAFAFGRQAPSPSIGGPRIPATVDPAGPKATRIPLPAIPGAFAIWGATGQDSRGHVWFGVATSRTPVPSAHLLEYDPVTARMTDRGNVVDELQRLGILRAGEHQAKIHSKIIQGPDGCLYFASMDEEDEHEDGSRLPTWGGHFWRLRLSSGRWEHLGATPEALIAVAGGDRFIYALGYFRHVLYQYDTRSGQLRRVEVGSVDGHISRNVVSDYRGHVYVPRLRAQPVGNGRKIMVSLVEFGTDLQELNETPIDAERYLNGNDATGSHGIIALQSMADRSIFFTTDRGYLFRLAPPAPATASTDRAPATLTPIRWIHPDGPMYAASLFTPDGTRTLFALARTAEGSYHWLTCATDAGSCRPASFAVAGMDPAVLARTSLYGSATRDANGGHYVVGITRAAQALEPIVLRVEP